MDLYERMAATQSEDDLDPYVATLAHHARSRGIGVAVLDAADGYLLLTCGDRRVVVRGALTPLTDAIAFSWCDNKRLTARVLAAAGLRVPESRTATFDAVDEEFLAAYDEIVVKPAEGEQGRGVTVGVRDGEALARARDVALQEDHTVLLEECVDGTDLRVVVIAGEVVAAAVRHPARVVGDGRASIADLVAARSAEREAETDGESTIPVDDHLRATVERAGYGLDDVLADGVTLEVRRTANLHTGGTLEDVTARLHPDLGRASVAAAEALGLPVAGVDLLVRSVGEPEYVIVEVNERPGLDNHQPQPTHERFLDLLFPATTSTG